MRPYWKGYLKLALVSCPIALHAACSSSERIAFRQINKATGNRLRQQLIDEETREPVAPEHKGRGYEVAKGQYLIVDDAVAQVIALYGKDIAPTHARPHETGLRLGRLLRYFGGMWLSDINGQTCRAYAEARGAQESARRELADLRAAINHHHAEGLCTQAVRVV